MKITIKDETSKPKTFDYVEVGQLFRFDCDGIAAVCQRGEGNLVTYLHKNPIKQMEINYMEEQLVTLLDGELTVWKAT